MFRKCRVYQDSRQFLNQNNFRNANLSLINFFTKSRDSTCCIQRYFPHDHEHFTRFLDSLSGLKNANRLLCREANKVVCFQSLERFCFSVIYTNGFFLGFSIIVHAGFQICFAYVTS